MSTPAIYITTSQFSDILGLKKPTLLARLKTHGNVYGVVPNRLPNGRLVWPRHAALAAAGLSGAASSLTDLADTLDFFTARELPPNDPVVVSAANALTSTYSGPGYQAQAADDMRAHLVWTTAAIQRITNALPHIHQLERQQIAYEAKAIITKLQALYLELGV